MPLVLTQHASRDLNRYLDREGVIYHFPQMYLGVVNRALQQFGDRRFLYHRPTKGVSPEFAGYFAYGQFGDPYEDTRNPNHYWIDILDSHPLRIVPLRDNRGIYYESGTGDPPFFRGRSIRYIDPLVYYNILAAGQVYSEAPVPYIDAQLSGNYSGSMPKDDFRDLSEVPPGTGYVPRQSEPPSVFEAAALHERARDDHQRTLAILSRQIKNSGGVCLYNNNVDLFAKIGEKRFLVEAKSLTRQEVAVSRMRYGIGQLMDYGVRYRAELQGAQPVLAFGSPVTAEVSWISTILQENGIAFVTRLGDHVRAANALAEEIEFITN